MATRHVTRYYESERHVHTELPIWQAGILTWSHEANTTGVTCLRGEWAPIGVTLRWWHTRGGYASYVIRRQPRTKKIHMLAEGTANKRRRYAIAESRWIRLREEQTVVTRHNSTQEATLWNVTHTRYYVTGARWRRNTRQRHGTATERSRIYYASQYRPANNRHFISIMNTSLH